MNFDPTLTPLKKKRPLGFVGPTHRHVLDIHDEHCLLFSSQTPDHLFWLLPRLFLFLQRSSHTLLHLATFPPIPPAAWHGPFSGKLLPSAPTAGTLLQCLLETPNTYEGPYAQHHTCTDDCINTCGRDEGEGSCRPGKLKGTGASAQSTGHRLWVQPRLLAGWRTHQLGAAPALPFTASVNSSLQHCLHRSGQRLCPGGSLGS